MKLLKAINELNRKFPRDISEEVVDSVHELSFLRIILAWESFIEKSFIYYILGEKTANGYAPISFVKPRDETHAYNIIKGGHRYPDWLNLEFIREKSELFFENGEPFKTTLYISNIKGALDDMKILRNVIVHISASAKKKYENLLRRELGSALPYIQPGKFLQKMRKTSNKTYFTYFKEILEIASAEIIK